MKRQAFWEDRYKGEGYLFGTEPNDFLLEEAGRLTPGLRTLAVADGEGRNGVWLAKQGLDVLSVDFSENGLAKARALATDRGVSIETLQVDLTSWVWPTASFDLVVTFFIHPPAQEQGPLLENMFRALKPGGQLIFEAYAKAQAENEFGGPDDPDRLFSSDILRQAIEGAEILLLEEKTIIRRSGRFPGKPAAVVRLIARHP
ncbi:MAG: class I SAM-dependent methyltransferase [Rhodospirillaceae bacterium]|jgi:SAM-dependent methyltransferase|nr:class I SAM-dependent methyltransferase [Rhodospirillaceae bacterium]MBT4043070.1 class I SAM-dependent methyltransferase [Rhodospirillaceae bacterium]MBT4688053.1 class I SAM-dependent methyltransferase [Rhodospirillaceae bacterium]MBT5081717.1 class I SAM-dependent methyltransferase [Rhodospirillaceae bacterium]MBT5527421.1 class I SAM-dependent methyltransferase [Rhodospirillaceae bacterium]